MRCSGGRGCVGGWKRLGEDQEGVVGLEAGRGWERSAARWGGGRARPRRSGGELEQRGGAGGAQSGGGRVQPAGGAAAVALEREGGLASRHPRRVFGPIMGVVA